MSTTDCRAALAQPEPEGGLLGLDDLRDAWNAQADAANSWDELGLDEIIHFAQQQAIVRQCRPAVEPMPVAYIHRRGNHCEVSERPLYDKERNRGWTDEPLYTRQQQPPAPEVQRDAVIAAVTEVLGNAYDCLRVWEAWRVGTMGEDDFVLVTEDPDRVAEIADAAIEAMRLAAASPALAQPEPEGFTLNWSEKREPCEECRYNHCIAETPLGKIVISWKGWKEYSGITVYGAPFSDWFYECWNSVEDAKSWCQVEYSRRLAAIVSNYSAVAPVALADRQPTMEAGDLDSEGRCWWGDAGDEQFVPSWRLCERPNDSHFTHWRPHWAIPLPATLQEAYR